MTVIEMLAVILSQTLNLISNMKKKIPLSVLEKFQPFVDDNLDLIASYR